MRTPPRSGISRNAFRAGRTGGQGIAASNVSTKIPFNLMDGPAVGWDIANGHFAPTEIGVWHFSWQVTADAAMTFGDSVAWYSFLAKNGVGIYENVVKQAGQIGAPRSGGAAQVICKPGDTIALFFLHNDSVGHAPSSNNNLTWLHGHRIS